MHNIFGDSSSRSRSRGFTTAPLCLAVLMIHEFNRINSHAHLTHVTWSRSNYSSWKMRNKLSSWCQPTQYYWHKAGNNDVCGNGNGAPLRLNCPLLSNFFEIIYFGANFHETDSYVFVKAIRALIKSKIPLTALPLHRVLS
ncbi:hypothetical protein TcasGA2_TC000204 [Tribolium castaneum]|uniref:Uncharacterized protein n=1 Tax=Tribolium castaneum TaxID=7070 RepID=D6WC80_TRICA|nr:hypothetical protein TcasGA2_TC000204 [Tribolium castaneum]